MKNLSPIGALEQATAALDEEVYMREMFFDGLNNHRQNAQKHLLYRDKTREIKRLSSAMSVIVYDYKRVKEI